MKESEVELVSVCTPSGDHYQHTIQALNAGKHVVVEKPVALRLEHTYEMEQLAEEKGLKLWVSHQNRYNPAIIQAKKNHRFRAVGQTRIGNRTFALVP